MSGSCFLKLYLRTVFKKYGTQKMVFSKNCFCSLNLGYVCFKFLKLFFILKKQGEKEHVWFSWFFVFCFKKHIEYRQFSKKPFSSCFLKLFLSTVFKNIENIISMFSEFNVICVLCVL